MNYFPFHIGDYASATRHLSWDEDAAYRRLLDVYYTTEKPLPTELRAVCRLVIATTGRQREAVQIVLEEFFEPTQLGWVHHRADAEIESMRDKKSMVEIREKNENDRMRRHRERRAEMFSELRDFGVVPAWDTPMKELQRLHEQYCNAPETTEETATTEIETSQKCTSSAPETHLQRAPETTCNAPATAIPIPTPTPTPITTKTKTARKAALAAVQPESVSDDVWRDWIALRKRKAKPVTETAMAGIEREAAAAGLSLQAALQHCCAMGWAGFSADWLKPDVGSGGRQQKFDPVAHINRNRTGGGSYEQQFGGNVIDNVTP